MIQVGIGTYHLQADPRQSKIFNFCIYFNMIIMQPDTALGACADCINKKYTICKLKFRMIDHAPQHLTCSKTIWRGFMNWGYAYMQGVHVKNLLNRLGKRQDCLWQSRLDIPLSSATAIETYVHAYPKGRFGPRNALRFIKTYLQTWGLAFGNRGARGKWGDVCLSPGASHFTSFFPLLLFLSYLFWQYALWVRTFLTLCLYAMGWGP